MGFVNSFLLLFALYYCASFFFFFFFFTTVENRTHDRTDRAPRFGATAGAMQSWQAVLVLTAPNDQDRTGPLAGCGSKSSESDPYKPRWKVQVVGW